MDRKRHCSGPLIERCPECGQPMALYEGEFYCPDGPRWTVTEPNPLDDVEAVLLMAAVLISEEEGQP
jgi:hypothetical protein